MRSPWKRLLLVPAICLLFAASAQAASFDPGKEWKSIWTKHFRVHFPERLTPVAQKTARILEELYPKVTAQWNWEPFRYTEVVVVDNTDEANGMANLIPYNWILIYAVAPRPDSSLAHYDDWLRTLLAHEFTHIVQLDAVGGFWWLPRLVIGKTVAPSGMDPKWMREGLAQYDETIYTRGGRGRGAYSEMVVRTAVITDTFPPIDVADGMGWRWPGYKAPYIYGIKFVQWLVDTYGEEKLHQFDRRTRRSPLLAMINHQARNVYGKTFYELWREWQQSLQKRYEQELAEIRAKGITPSTVLLENIRDRQYAAPALSPDGKRLAYVVSSPHGPDRIEVLELSTGEITVVREKGGSTQLAWSPDGTKLAFSKVGGYKRYNAFFDLYLYDFEKPKRKRLRRLTAGERARSPSFLPSGKALVYVKGDSRYDLLKRIDIESRESVILTKEIDEYAQFANPRVSPDGRFIAVSKWTPDDGWRIFRFDVDGTHPKRLTRGSGLAIESHPVWTRDGRSVLFGSDESGIGNIYRVPAEGGEAVMVTNVVTGAAQPAVSPSGQLYAQSYGPEGFEIAQFEVDPLVGGGPAPEGLRGDGTGRRGGRGSARPGRGEGEGVDEGYSWRQENLTAKQRAEVEEALTGAMPSGRRYSLVPKKYVAFGQSLFIPRYILPNIFYADDALFASATLGGNDVLRWHNWDAGVTWRSDANYFGYHARYFYNRYRPLFGVQVRDYIVDFGNITFLNPNTGLTNTVHFYEKRRGVTPFIAVPIWRTVLSLSYFYEDHMPETRLTQAEQDALNLGIFSGMRARFVYGDAEKYPASISNENGRTIQLTGIITNSIFGSAERNEQIIFAGDWREYIRLFRHNVLALRAGGGITWGDQLVQGTFGLGGAIGEGSFAGGGSYNYFPLRGLPVSALSRTRAMLFSAEWRFPIASPQRGIGTWPVFFKEFSGALFADYGNAWNAHEGGSDSFKTFFDEFLLGVGAELRGDFVIGHGLPVHARLGYGIIVVNRDRLGRLTDPLLGSNVKYGMLLLALGTAF